MEATDGAQEPFTYGSLPGVDLYLAAPDAETTEDISKIWQDFRGSTSPQALRVFAEEYPGTAYASLALERTMELEGSAPTMHQTIGEKPEAAAALGALGSPSIGLNRKAFCGGADDLEGLICSDMTLSVLSSKLTAEFKAAIDKAGPTEQAHIFAEERKWREERDVCGLDRECLIEVYLVWTNRRAEMENNIDGLTPMEIVRLVQIELSRLGCYSGEADGNRWSADARCPRPVRARVVEYSPRRRPGQSIHLVDCAQPKIRSLQPLNRQEPPRHRIRPQATHDAARGRRCCHVWTAPFVQGLI